MAKVLEQKSRKEYICSKCKRTINIGEKYKKIVAMYRKPTIVCCDCKIARSELTTSEYYSWLYDFQDNINIETLEDAQEALEEIEMQKDELEEKYDNIPEQLQDAGAGCILQERIESLEEAYSEVEALINEIENFEDEDIEDHDVMEKYNEIVEVINSIC